MKSPLKLLRNLGTVLGNGPMAAAYGRWLLGRLSGTMEASSHFGARIGGFENFSNYWGTICKIPDVREFEFFASFLTGDSPVCFDIGANIGSFSVILGKQRPDARVHAFEPAAGTFRILQGNIARNRLQNVEAHRVAIAESDGTVRFSDEPSTSQRNHIVSGGESIPTCEVPSQSLDSFCAARGIPQIAFAKVDCEGVEPFVLRGAASLLADRRIGALLVEVCPRNLRAFGFTPRDLVTAIRDRPYAFHRFDEHGGIGEMVGEQDMNRFQSEDVLLLPNGRT